MFKIDLNSDLGESFGTYKLGMDEEVIQLVSSANIACGYHASDPLVMNQTILLAREHGIKIGAHPGFPDLMGFGRRNMVVSTSEAKAYMLYQMGALDAFCRSNQVKMQHVKPHGALYNMAAKDSVLAEAICEAIASFDPNLILLGLAGSQMIKAAKKKGLRVASEIFADRAYEEDGTLVDRRKEGSMITEEDLAIARMVRVVKKGIITSITGEDISVEAHSICVHGDGEKALLFVQRLHEVFATEGIAIAPLQEII